MISKCLIVDVETTDNKAGAAMIELGVILYSIKARAVLQQFSTLVETATPNEAEHVNRISAAALDEMGTIDREYFPLLREMLKQADVLVAHNAEFDSQFFDPQFWNGEVRPWLCTLRDFDWPEVRSGGFSLVNLALSFGIPVFANHSALTDCGLLAQVFNRVPDLEDRFTKAMRPKVLYRADVSYDNRHQASSVGFEWKGKLDGWQKRMAREDAEKLPFRVAEVAQAASR